MPRISFPNLPTRAYEVRVDLVLRAAIPERGKGCRSARETSCYASSAWPSRASLS